MNVALDWLAREGGIILIWWVLVTLAGAAALPVCARVLSNLPDRGYTLARAVGMLLVGFVFWLLASLGFLRNSAGSMIFAWGLVLVVGLVLYLRGQRMDWGAWWRENRGAVIVGEVLFVVLLTAWAMFRAFNPELRSTEKPMEMMMMNSIMQSETFPPHDAWLAGYSISYYYFGYVLAAMLTTLSRVASPIGFNMMSATLFALTGLTAFGVVYNLVRSRTLSNAGSALMGQLSAVGAGLLATFMIIWMSNLQFPLLQLPYQLGYNSNAYFEFWDTQQGYTPLPQARPDPAAWGNWWWFDASRVIRDRHLPQPFGTDPRGNPVFAEPIDEFPNFSFLLADNHPHVLALPFVVLALALALNRLLDANKPRPDEVIFSGICLGGLVFLNAWDGPIYMALMVGVEVLRRLRANKRLTYEDWFEAFGLGVALVALTAVLYLPFFISFRSQASGILPNLTFPTLFQQFFLVNGGFLLLLIPFLVVEAWRARDAINWGLGWRAALGVLLALIGVLVGISLFALIVPQFRPAAQGFIDQLGGMQSALLAVLARRFSPLHLLTTIVLVIGVGVVVARLFPRRDEVKVDQPIYPAATGFALLLIGVGVMLTLMPEFFYLRDNFGVRINTIFKFYYQAWIVFSVASAYAAYSLLSDMELELPPVFVRAVVAVVLFVLIGAGSLYGAFGVLSRTTYEGESRGNPLATPATLDGGLTMMPYDDYAVVQCLARVVGERADQVIVAEGIGSSYWVLPTQTGRVGALTGIVTVLGWENHESQWRGAAYRELVGTREQDMPELYSTTRWDVAELIINSYEIDYVIYTQSERTKYGASGEIKFIENAVDVCPGVAGSATVYRVR